MKYALVGCGRISPNHIAAALDNHLEIVGLCDINQDRIKAIQEKFGIENVPQFTNYSELLRCQKPELVAIATESGKHAVIALDCIKAGCNVIIEKPIALSLQDADQIIELANHENVKVCACHQNRFNKAIQEIRKAVESGRFGKMFYGTAHIRWNRGKDYYTQAPWRGTYEQDGGALMNQCIHNIDLLRWMMGDDVIEVTAYTDNLNHPYIEAEDLGLALIKFQSGAYGIVEGTTNVFPQNLEETLYLFGQKGTVKAGGKSVNTIDEWRFADNLDDAEQIKEKYHENPPNVYGFGHKPLYKDMIMAIEENRMPFVDAYAGRRALELVLAIYQSAQLGRTVKLPLLRCSTMDFVNQVKI